MLVPSQPAVLSLPTGLLRAETGGSHAPERAERAAAPPNPAPPLDREPQRSSAAPGPKATARRPQATHPGQRGGMEAEDFQEELTCAICLDYFEDPVSIECGIRNCVGEGFFIC